MTPLSSTRKQEQEQPTLDDKILNVTGTTCHILVVGVGFLLAQTLILILAVKKCCKTMCALTFYMHLMLLIYLCCEFYVSFKKAKATTSVGCTYFFTGLYNGSVTLEEKYQCNRFGAIKKIALKNWLWRLSGCQDVDHAISSMPAQPLWIAGYLHRSPVTQQSQFVYN